MPDSEYYQRIAEEAAREADQTSMDRMDMARILECLNEGGRVEWEEVRNELKNRITPLTKRDNLSGYFLLASFVLFVVALPCIGFVGAKRMFP